MDDINNKTYTGKGSSDEIKEDPVIRQLGMDFKPTAPLIAQKFIQLDEEGSLKPDRKSICGAFVYTDTITYFFSRTNYGKSILAFQIALAAATGKSVHDCHALRNECDPMKVLLVDLENDAKTIHDRHKLVAKVNDPFLLDNLIFGHEDTEQPMSLGIGLLVKIGQCAVENEAKLIIIDNISRLLPDALTADIVTRMIACLQRIRQLTGAALLVIGHTTKSDPKTAVSSVSYYGSAMIQNFFTEVFYLDMTRDGKFFLRHGKTKREESYMDIVPVLTRGSHDTAGLGFTFEALRQLSDIQLPSTLESEIKHYRSRNLAEYRDGIDILLKAGKSQRYIAGFVGVAPSSINYLLNHQ